MPTPRRIRNTPSRSTLLPRRNPQRPGMGGTNLPQRNNPLKSFFQNNVDPSVWKPATGVKQAGGNPAMEKAAVGAVQAGGGGGLWQGPQQTPITDNMGVAAALRALGMSGVAPQGGFGFNQDQRSAILDELQQLQGGLNGERTPNFDWNKAYGVAGNLRNWERQAGVKGGIQPLGLSMDQRAAFAQAVDPGRPVVQPGQEYPNGGGPGGGIHPGHPQHQNPGQSPPWNPNGPWQNGGKPPWMHNQNPGPTDQGHYPGGPVTYPQAGQIPYGQFPGQYSPGNIHPGAGPQFPGQYSPGNPGGGGYGPMQAPGGMPYNTGFTGVNPMQQPQGVVPPFSPGSIQARTSPQTAAAPSPAAAPQAAPQTAPGASQAGFQAPGGQPYFQFNPVNLPNFQQGIQGTYGALPTPPPYLTGAGLQQWQAAMNSLNSNLAGLGAQYGQIAPQYNYAGQQLMTNYDIDRTGLAGGLANRGIFEGGLANQQFQNQIGDYNRQAFDLRQQAQGSVTDIMNQAAQSMGLTNEQLVALMGQMAQEQSQNPNAPYPEPKHPKRNNGDHKKGGKK